MRWAFQQSNLRSSVKFVLVALADRANDEGECWPSRETIAQDTCLNPETVSKCTEELVALGLIEKHRRFASSIVFRLVGIPARHTEASSGKSRQRGKPAKGENPIEGECRHPSAGNPAPNLPMNLSFSSDEEKGAGARKFDVFDIPEGIERDAWADWVEYRRERRKTITAISAREQWRALSRLNPTQQSDCIRESIRNGWTGLFPERLGKVTPINSTRTRSIAEDLTDRSWAS